MWFKTIFTFSERLLTMNQKQILEALANGALTVEQASAMLSVQTEKPIVFKGQPENKGVSVYGLHAGRPITFNVRQWNRLLEARAELEAALKSYEAGTLEIVSKKEEEETPAKAAA